MSTFDLFRMRKDLDSMYSELKEFHDSNQYIYIIIFKLETKFNDVKDLFIRLKFQISEKISKFEALLQQKEKYEDSSNDKEILEKKKIEKKLENLIKELKSDIIDLEKELKSQQKKKNKYHDLEQKGQIYNLLKEKIQILEKKFNGEEVENELQENKENIEQLEDFLKKSNFNGNSEQRELYEEERIKIDEWDKRKKIQDEKLDEIGRGIKELKNEAIKAGEGIKGVGIKVEGIGGHIDKTGKTIKTQNERVKELITKIRSSDKICCDILLILLLCGLICVLYSIIKHKF